MIREMKLITSKGLKIMSDTGACCRIWPLTVVVRVRAGRSATLGFDPRTYRQEGVEPLWPVRKGHPCAAGSRAVTSLAQVNPNTCSGMFSTAALRQVLPMTRASSPLEIHLFGLGGAAGIVWPGPDDCRRRLEENERLVRQGLAHFLGVAPVVEPHANHLGRKNGRQDKHLVQGDWIRESELLVQADQLVSGQPGVEHAVFRIAPGLRA